MFLCLVLVAGGIVWKTRLKELKTDTFLSDQSIINFDKFNLGIKMRVESEVVPPPPAHLLKGG